MGVTSGIIIVTGNDVRSRNGGSSVLPDLLGTTSTTYGILASTLWKNTTVGDGRLSLLGVVTSVSNAPDNTFGVHTGNTLTSHRVARGISVHRGRNISNVRVVVGPGAGGRGVRVPMVVDRDNLARVICGSFVINRGYSIRVITNYNVRGYNDRRSHRSNVRAFFVNGGSEIGCIRGRINRNSNRNNGGVGPAAIVGVTRNNCVRVRAARVGNVSSAGHVAGTELSSGTALVIGRGLVARNDRCTRASFAISLSNRRSDTGIVSHSITGSGSGRLFISHVGNGGVYGNRARYSTVVVSGTRISTLPRVATGRVSTTLVRRTTVNGVTNRRLVGLVALKLSRDTTRRRVMGKFLGWYSVWSQ